MTTYEEQRSAYWAAQTELRTAAIAEIQAQMPANVHRIKLELNETPRLTVTDMLDAEGQSLMDEYDATEEYDTLDQIAVDMEITDYQEGKSHLQRDEQGVFVIDRVEPTSVYWCAECGTNTADTYVVTTLDFEDPESTSTEVCLRCHREIAAQEELVEVLEAIAYCEAEYDEQEGEDPASRLKQAVVDYLSKLGLPTHPTDDDGAQVQLAGTETL